MSSAQTTIDVKATGCGQLYLYEFNGASFDNAATFERSADGNFTLTVNFAEPKFRYVGSKPGDVLPVLLQPGETFTVTGACGRLRNGKLEGSPANTAYQELKTTFQQHNQQFTQATRGWQRANSSGDSALVATSLATLQSIDDAKLATLTALRKDNPILGRVASMNTYRSFLTNNNGRFANELDYFVNTYFDQVDFQDPGYNDLPWTYEGNRNFANTLSAAVPGEQLADILLQVYQQWPAGSRAKLFATNGAFAALVQKKHPAALKLGEAIVKEFKGTYPEATAFAEEQAASLATFAIGAEAPGFAGQSPDGETITLESLRGKVVLIDFWASWCGPCRKENPNVVRVYDEYKDKGFEILGVSLDNKKDRWVKAIADDNLTWPQISDLQGWRSAVARQYGVSSIPQTVLLDAEGRILARNLRGAALEQKLAEVFAGK